MVDGPGLGSVGDGPPDPGSGGKSALTRGRASPSPSTTKGGSSAIFRFGGPGGAALESVVVLNSLHPSKLHDAARTRYRPFGIPVPPRT